MTIALRYAALSPVAVLFLTAATLTGCGLGSAGDPVVVADVAPAQSASDEPGPTLPDEDYAGRFTATATVLQAPGGDAELCAGGVNDSLPPQCGGPPIVGWSWDAVDHETVAGVSWGVYTAVGTWDGQALTLTEPATAAAPSAADLGYTDVDFTAPCAAPAGGWAPVDPARSTQADFDAAAMLAQGLDGHGGLWIDQNLDGENPTEEEANDPARFVLVVTTTADVATVEAAIREVWGGALCVAPARSTEAELAAIQSTVSQALPDVLSSGVSVVTGTVDVLVLVATVEAQQQLDDEYGAGVVRLSGALRPID